ncbi:MAG: 50S ribosomal protein L5 [Candidatus Peregrinibacteria bacterium]|nr:50S ribosomal protein L5 [Candidatus Peregrinibacteria bacterium]
MNFAENYKKNILPALKKELGKKNSMAVPMLKCVKVHVGIGSVMTRGNKDYDSIIANVATITGQKPVVTLAKKAISNFKSRIGLPTGIVVTLRGKRMFEFLNKLINVVMPRIRDFRGLTRRSLDEQGSYSLGLKEHTVFPEINPDDIEKAHGVQITIVTTATNKDDGFALLSALGFPFKKDELISDKKSKKKS